MNSKVYVSVNARFEPDRRMTPLYLVWEDGREYERIRSSTSGMLPA